MRKKFFIILSIIIILVGCSNKNDGLLDSKDTTGNNKLMDESVEAEQDYENESNLLNSEKNDKELIINKKISMVSFKETDESIDPIGKGFIDGCEAAGVDYELIDIPKSDRETRIKKLEQYTQQAEITGICLKFVHGPSDVDEDYYSSLASDKYVWLNYFDPDQNYDKSIDDADIIALTPSCRDHVEAVFSYLQNTYGSETSVGAACFKQIDFKVLLNKKIQEFYPNSPEIINPEDFLMEENAEKYLSQTDVIYCDKPEVLKLLLDMNCEQPIIYGASSYETNYIEILELVKSGRVDAIIQKYDCYEMGYMAAMYLSGHKVLDEKEFRLAPIVISTPEQAQHIIDVLQK